MIWLLPTHVSCGLTCAAVHSLERLHKVQKVGSEPDRLTYVTTSACPESFTGHSDTLRATRPELHCPRCSLWVCQCPNRCHTYLHISLEVAAFGHLDSSYCQAARSSLHCPRHGIRSHSQTSSLRGEVQVRVPVSRLPIVKFNALAKAFRRVFERAWFGNHSADALPGIACSWGCVTYLLSSLFA
jgi:hypothetical protein